MVNELSLTPIRSQAVGTGLSGSRRSLQEGQPAIDPHDIAVGDRGVCKPKVRNSLGVHGHCHDTNGRTMAICAIVTMFGWFWLDVNFGEKVRMRTAMTSAPLHFTMTHNMRIRRCGQPKLTDRQRQHNKGTEAEPQPVLGVVFSGLKISFLSFILYCQLTFPSELMFYI